MHTKYVLTAMFYPEECALQLTGYSGKRQELQCRHDITPIAYSECPLLSTVNKSAWGFHYAGTVGGCPNNSVIKQAGGFWKEVIFDLQSTYVVDWVDWWPEQTARVPTDWFLDISLDGETYIRALTMSQFENEGRLGYVINAACKLENGRMTLLPMKAQFLRLCFDETARQNHLDEWAVEIKLAPDPETRAHAVVRPDLAPPTMFW
jgi:hypothetical protein